MSGGIECPLPAYQKDRRRWRREILECVRAANERKRVIHEDSDLDVTVLLYLRGKQDLVHDVDNRVKDVLDALQARDGRSRAGRAKARLIDNDNRVRRLLVEKQPRPKIWKNASVDVLLRAGGRIRIRPYVRRKWPLES
jgi:Holliday junction resolvase RusA-like endonuclease